MKSIEMPEIEEARLWISRRDQGLSVEDMVEKALVPKEESPLDRDQRLFDERRARELRDEANDVLPMVRALTGAVCGVVLLFILSVSSVALGVFGLFTQSDEYGELPNWVPTLGWGGVVMTIISIAAGCATTVTLWECKRKYRDRMRQLREHFIEMGQVIE